MRASKVCNLSLLNTIAKAKEISYEELKAKYLPPKQLGIIQSIAVTFDSDLKDLETEGYISISDGKIRYVRR